MSGWGLLALFLIGLAVFIVTALEYWAADAWERKVWRKKARKRGWIPSYWRK